jgi:hypothetical protein
VSWDKEKGAIIRWVDYSEKSLAKIQDIELLTLKGHLLIEDALKFLLATRLHVEEEVLFDLSIDSFPLIELALAGKDGDDVAHLRGALRAINNARNRMAHRIESPEFVEKIETFVREIGYMRKRTVPWPSAVDQQTEVFRAALDEAIIEIFGIATSGPATPVPPLSKPKTK